ncbi:L-xylulose reductase [Glaciecola punicea ACAM 611]|jgi:NAD(P)-dependent dehydrogenase (short-subunit alcohol dehydrogenase family)|uniref:L-xylulose reductase n=1 Tax=Glaciecola punicea ACAM 611 TaxID=1121923 RepID=H5TCG4_9ALTE|nr:SDR family oxidoreductase [Glaciecola punicea]OFA31910.1 3-oxoacyl-ACP reductase [Glaciecola punicea]GAB55991.1 L-xylulose reductase [Glaciecola punicea ACAM 611]
MSGFSADLLVGKSILVTGAGKGIGRACAILAAQCGARVIAVARTRADLVSLRQLAGQNIEVWEEDVTNESFVQRVRALKELHGLINNVGTNRVAPMLEQADQDLDDVVDINIKSMYRTAKAAAAKMTESGGAIVNMSSQMGFVGSPNRTLYCMSKHAVEGLSKAMAVELAEKHIRVNTVAPTFVLTELTEPMFKNPDFKKFVYDMIPMKSLATTDDVANACVFLLSDLSAMITGTCIKVDGGWTAR